MEYPTVVQVSPSPYTPLEETVKLAQKEIIVFQEQRKSQEDKSVRKKWFILEFAWNPEGKWHLTNNHAILNLPTPEGDQPIKRLPPYQA